jgi:DNA adenine methylase
MEVLDKMKVTAIAPWFGGKRTMAPDIVKQLGQHSAYWEPFCGSMAVLLAKPESSHETVNDLHGDLINLARVIADDEMYMRLYDRASRVLCDEERRDESIALLRTATDPLDRAFHYFVIQWMGRNGFSGTVGPSPFAGRRTGVMVGSGLLPRWTASQLGTNGCDGSRFCSAMRSR